MRGLRFCFVFCFFIVGLSMVYADNDNSSNEAQDTAAGTDWKQELISGRQEMQEQRQQMKENAQSARTEEKELKDQIQAAVQSGNMESARQLRDQLKAMHQENVQQMIQDKKELQSERRDLRQDLQQARQEGAIPPRKDRDNNPPGPKGGRGTNWENKPGPQGGPGASPNKRPAAGGSGRRR